MDVLNAFTIDVENWFNMLDIPGHPTESDWTEFEDRDTEYTLKMLDLLDRHGVKGTCFMLGWTVDNRPGLLEEIIRRGHEVASHGYGHKLLYEMTPDDFREDLERSKEAIKRAGGSPPLGYRVPGFSLTEQTPWAFEVLADAGFEYDSSLFPGARGHGGIPQAPRLPHYIDLPDGRQLREFPISVKEVFGRRCAYVGGGYLRLFPYPLIRRWMRQANERGESVILYIHPHDADADQPRFRMPLKRRFKCYVNLHTTLDKLDRLLADFRWGSAIEVLDQILPAEASAGAPRLSISDICRRS